MKLKLLAVLVALTLAPTISLAEEFVKGQDVQRLSSSAFVTIFEYFNPDCPHCQAQEPILSDVKRLYPDVKIYKVNAPDPILKEIYNVFGTPELIIFKDEESRYQVHGFISFLNLKKLIALPYRPKQGDYGTLPTEIKSGCCAGAEGGVK